MKTITILYNQKQYIFIWTNVKFLIWSCFVVLVSDFRKFPSSSIGMQK
jgi:hypothetical protein